MIAPSRELQAKPGVADASAVEKLDIAAAETLAAHRRHPVVRAAARFSEIGDQPPLFALGGALTAGGLLFRNARLLEAGLRVLAAEALATGAKHLIKRSVRRSRPHVLLDEGEYRAEMAKPPRKPEQSFPSGHTAGAVAVAGAAAIGLIQTPRGAHYPSDIAAGAAIGAASAWAVHHLAGLIQRRLRL